MKSFFQGMSIFIVILCLIATPFYFWLWKYTVEFRVYNEYDIKTNQMVYSATVFHRYHFNTVRMEFYGNLSKDSLSKCRQFEDSLGVVIEKSLEKK